jgi:hypothetical protein
MATLDLVMAFGAHLAAAPSKDHPPNVAAACLPQSQLSASSAGAGADDGLVGTRPESAHAE